MKTREPREEASRPRGQLAVVDGGPFHVLRASPALPDASCSTQWGLGRASPQWNLFGEALSCLLSLEPVPHAATSPCHSPTPAIQDLGLRNSFITRIRGGHIWEARGE